MTKRQQKGETREALVVRAAAQAIAERGLANVRVADVAERAGMSPGHVTYYFPSKSGLLIRAIRQSEQDLAARVDQELRTIDDPWRRLDRLIEVSASAGPGDTAWALWFEVWTSASLDPEVASVHDELDRRWRDILIDVIVYGRERGAFAAPNPEAIALLLSTMIDGLSIQLTLGSAGMTSERLLELCRMAARTFLDPGSG